MTKGSERILAYSSMALSIDNLKQALLDLKIALRDESVFFAEHPDADSALRQLVATGRLTEYQAQFIRARKHKSLEIGSYLITDELGKGAYGTVFKAIQPTFHRDVAIKLIDTGSTDTTAIGRALREIEAAGAVMHPNVVTALDAGEVSGHHFLVMEYVAGNTLAALVEEDGALSVDRCVDIFIQAASGVAHLHKRGIVHCDIKPSNLIVDNEGIVKVVDFGFSHIDQGFADATPDATASHDIPSAFTGTAAYAAPEQQAFVAYDVDARSDLYGLGCTLFYCLFGKPLFPSGNIIEVLHAHRERAVPDLLAILTAKDVESHVAAVLDSILRQLLAKKPSDRYQEATSLIADLEHLRHLLDDSEVSREEDAPIARSVTYVASIANTYRYLGRTIGEEELFQWFYNFDQSEWPLCEKLLRIVLGRYFIDEEVFRAACSTLAEWLENISDTLDDLVLVPLHTETTGGQHVLLAISDILGRPATSIARFDDLKPAVVKDKTIVLVDDFCWTGETAISQLNRFLEKDEAFRGCQRLYVAFAFASDDGVKSVESVLQGTATTFAAKRFTKSDKVFSSSFQGLTRSERKQLRTLCNKHASIACAADLSANSPTGYRDSQSLVIFYYNAPSNTLPILWSDQGGWRPLFPRSSRYPRLIPATPNFVERSKELATLSEGFGGDRRHFVVSGESGKGKTYVVSHFVTSVLPRYSADGPRSVFWHPFRRMTTYEHLQENLSYFLHDQGFDQIASALRKAAATPERLASFLSETLTRRHVLVFDRFEDVRKESKAWMFLAALLTRDPQNAPQCVVIGQNAEELLETGGVKQATIPVVSVESLTKPEARKLVRSIWNSVRRSNPHLTPLQDRGRVIVGIGLSGDPIVTSMATSLGLAVRSDEELKKVAEQCAMAREPTRVLLQALWSRLSPDAQLMLGIASCLIPPRYTARIESAFSRISKDIGSELGSFAATTREFDSIGNPFFRRTGHGDVEICQMTAFVRRMLQQELKEQELLRLPFGFDVRDLHEVIASILRDSVAGGARSPRIRVSLSEQIILAHYHYLAAQRYRDCTELLRQYRGDILSSDRLEAFLEIVTTLLSSAEVQLSIEDSLWLAQLKLKLLRRLTRHGEEQRFVQYWLDRVPIKHELEAAILLLYRATSNSAFAHYEKTLDDCNECLAVLNRSNAQDSFRVFSIRSRAHSRIAQTAMSLGRMKDATAAIDTILQDIDKLGFDVHSNLETPDPPLPTERIRAILHTQAMVYRHMSTLWFLYGNAENAEKWIRRCRNVNEQVPDAEGIAICDYKAARVCWLRDGLSTEDLRVALELSSSAYQQLRPFTSGHEWWRLALLEQMANLNIDLARLSQSSDQIRAESLHEAQNWLGEARSTLKLLTAAGEEREAIVRLWEVRLVEAKLYGEIDERSEARDAFASLIKELSLEDLPFMDAVARYEFGYYLQRWGETQEALEHLEQAVVLLMGAGLREMAVHALKRLYSCAASQRAESLLAVRVASSHGASALSDALQMHTTRTVFREHFEESMSEVLSLEPDRQLNILKQLASYFQRFALPRDAVVVLRDRVEGIVGDISSKRVVLEWVRASSDQLAESDEAPDIRRALSDLDALCESIFVANQSLDSSDTTHVGRAKPPTAEPNGTGDVQTRFWRTLIAIESVDHSTAPAIVHAELPGWKPGEPVEFPITLIPERLRAYVQSGEYLYAKVNLSAQTAHAIVLRDFEYRGRR